MTLIFIFLSKSVGIPENVRDFSSNFNHIGIPVTLYCRVKRSDPAKFNKLGSNVKVFGSIVNEKISLIYGYPCLSNCDYNKLFCYGPLYDTLIVRLFIIFFYNPISSR